MSLQSFKKRPFEAFELMKNRKDSRRQRSPNSRFLRQTTLGDDSSVLPAQDPAGQRPLTPAVLLNLQKDVLSDPPSAFGAGGEKRIPKPPSESSSSPLTMAQDTFAPSKMPSSSPTSLSASTIRRPSLQDFPSPEVLIKQDSRMSMYTPVPDTTMDNLSGVKM